MILYWSNTYYSLAADVKSKANSVEVDPLGGGSFLPDEFTITHIQANGLSIDNNVGWTDLIELIISEDELSRPVKFQTNIFYIRQAVEAFARSPFKWVQSERVNMGEVLAVRLTDKPQWAHPLQNQKFLEITLKLQGQVFHQNNP